VGFRVFQLLRPRLLFVVRELFEPQKYPDLGDDTPYDAAGWTLPYQMNVNVVEAQSPLSVDFRGAMKAVHGTAVDWQTNPDEPFTTNAMAAGIVPPAGGITGSGEQISLDPAQTNTFRFIARALADGASIRFAAANGARGARYIVTNLDASKADALAKELFVHAERIAASDANAVAVPTRIALYKSAPGVMDEGWTEWLLDTYGFKYTLITPADLRAGGDGLASRFDAIILASQGLGATGRGGRGGGRGRANPVADSAAAKEVRGLDDFVKSGGTVVAWNQGAASVATALRLPVRNVVQGVSRRDLTDVHP